MPLSASLHRDTHAPQTSDPIPPPDTCPSCSAGAASGSATLTSTSQRHHDAWELRLCGEAVTSPLRSALSHARCKGTRTLIAAQGLHAPASIPMCKRRRPAAAAAGGHKHPGSPDRHDRCSQAFLWPSSMIAQFSKQEVSWMIVKESSMLHK